MAGFAAHLTMLTSQLETRGQVVELIHDTDARRGCIGRLHIGYQQRTDHDQAQHRP